MNSFPFQPLPRPADAGLPARVVVKSMAPAGGLRWMQLGLLTGALLGTEIVPARAAEVFYDNTTASSAELFSSLDEFGDEIQLLDSGRDITQFAVEYFGDFVPTGQESVRVRFYVNDGVDVDPRPDKVIRGPGTVLYDSGPQPIYPGFNALALLGIKVPTPQTLIWTVQFSGVSGETNSSASLVLNNPPTVGKSFDDFWQFKDLNWGLFRFNGAPVANYISRVKVSPDTPPAILDQIDLEDGSVQLAFTGAIGSVLSVDLSTNSTDWVSLTNVTVSKRIESFVHKDAAQFPGRQYRVAPVLKVRPQFLGVVAGSGTNVVLKALGPVGEIYDVLGSTNLTDWVTIASGVFPAGAVDFEIPSQPEPARFFRLKSLGTLNAELVPDSLSVVNDGRGFRVGLTGFPGDPVVIESSTNLVNWTPRSTNLFSFVSGSVTVVDQGVDTTPARFYRTRPYTPPAP